MISYEVFEKYILFLKRQSEYSQNMQNLLHEYSDVMTDAEVPIEQSWFQQIDLLEMLMGIEKDDSGYSTLLWWIQEQDFGNKPGQPLMKDTIGCEESIDFSTIRGIYDFLTVEADWSFRQRLLKELRNSPVTVNDVADGLAVSMSRELYMGLTELFLNNFSMTLEELLTSFVEWCAKDPEAFEQWLQSVETENIIDEPQQEDLQISEKTLSMMDYSIGNLKQGIVSDGVSARESFKDAEGNKGRTAKRGITDNDNQY